MKVIAKLIDHAQGHWQEGGVRSVIRLFRAVLIHCSGAIYTNGKGINEKLRYCPCCDWTGRRFLPQIAKGYSSFDVWCPRCHSAPRHRGHMYYYKDICKLFQKHGGVLYFAPEHGILPHLKEASGLTVETTDLGNIPDCDHQYDIMNIDVPDCEFDYILCHRVIEHVPDDRRAMREIYRVLKPGGVAIISVPITRSLQKTEEYGSANPNFNDHYYNYGLDFVERIPMEFNFTEYLFSNLFDEKTFELLALSEDSIFELHKPE